jgi:hypothetical protein
MWQCQMVISQRQPQLSLQPREVFGEAIGTPCEATIALTRCQVVAFNRAGVNGCTGWQQGQLLGKRLRITEDHFAVDLYDTAMGSRLQNLGIQQGGWWREQGFGRAASLPLAWRLVPHAIGLEQRPSILGSLIAREERHVCISDMQNSVEQHISALLRPFTNREGHHKPPGWGEGHPHPRITIGLIVEPSKR